MYIWTIPPTKQKKNVLSLRAAKGENGATTTTTMTTTMLPRHRLYRNDIDSIVGLLNIRRRLTAGRTRIYARESTIVLFKNGFTRSHTARTFDSGGAHTHPRIHTHSHTRTRNTPIAVCAQSLSQSKRYSSFFVARGQRRKCRILDWAVLNRGLQRSALLCRNF